MSPQVDSLGIYQRYSKHQNQRKKQGLAISFSKHKRGPRKEKCQDERAVNVHPYEGNQGDSPEVFVIACLPFEQSQ